MRRAEQQSRKRAWTPHAPIPRQIQVPLAESLLQPLQEPVPRAEPSGVAGCVPRLLPLPLAARQLQQPSHRSAQQSRQERTRGPLSLVKISCERSFILCVYG
jgi:hypothetical protein